MEIVNKAGVIAIVINIASLDKETIKCVCVGGEGVGAVGPPSWE